MRKIAHLGLLPVLALTSAGVVAAPPTGFSYDDYTVAAGVVTASCPVGFTCTNLEAAGNGILQQRVTDGTDTYFRTIVVEDGVNAADLAAVQAMGFRNESYVGTGDTIGEYSVQNIVQADGPLQLAIFTDTSGGTGTNAVTSPLTDAVYTMAEISNSGVSLEQTNILGQANQTSSTGVPGPAVVNRGMKFSGSGDGTSLSEMRLDVVQAGNEGNMTVRKMTATAAGSLVLTDADGTIPALTYSSGDQVKVVWLEQAQSTPGPNPQSLPTFMHRLGQQIYTNVTTGEEISYNNGDAAGNFPVTLTTAGAPIEGIGPWNWDTALFGTEPVPYLTNGTANGTTLQAGYGSFPD